MAQLVEQRPYKAKVGSSSLSGSTTEGLVHVLTDVDRAHLVRCVELARWAAAHLTPEQRSGATVYTSGEHCAMCAAAHGWVGLGRIVYASSSAQLLRWLSEAGAAPPPVRPLPVQEVAPGVVVQGPVDDLAEQVRALQLESHVR